MKKLLLLFVFISSVGKSQCNASSFSPIDIAYPSQTKNIPASMQTDLIYLCMPASVVYDTLNPTSIKYRQVFVNQGTTYHYKSTLPNNQMTLYAKGGSNVIIYPGTNTAFSFVVYKETGATITNLSTGTITINNCTAITGPSVNCTPLGINTNIQNDVASNVWPNPAHDKLFISTENGKDKTVSIVNLLGEVVYTQKGIKEEKQEISLGTFAAGIYYVIIKSEGTTETKKIVVTK